MTQDECKKSIVKAIELLGLRHGHERAFRDWCECMALALQNGAMLFHDKKWEAREKAFIEINNQYSKDEQKLFPQMMNALVEWLEHNPFQDALGQLYMELFASQTKSKTLGQCFTPYSVASASARISIGEMTDEDLEQYSIANPLTLNDCSVGGGIMLIAACEALHERKFDWQHKAKFVAGDVDRLCVHMCYVQLSLIGARAIVKHQDALSLQKYGDDLFTPMELLWPMTFTYEQPRKEPETPQIESVQVEEVQTPIEQPKAPQRPKKAKQLTLF